MKLLTAIVAAVIGIMLIAAAITVVEEESSETNTLDVFVVGGQSNTYPKNNTNPATATPVPESGTGFYFGTDSDPTYNKDMDLSACEMHDLNDNGSAAIGGLYPSFAAEYTEKTGHSVYLIDTGLSGQPIATFLPGGHNYSWPGEVISAAMAAIPSDYDVKIKGYIWVHGEGDKTNPTQTYEVKMIELYDLYSGGDLPIKLPTCYICKARSAEGGNAEVAQKWLANNIPGFVMASELAETFTQENGYLGTDDLHYTQAGFNVLGVDLAENISADVIEKQPEDYTQLLLVVVPILIIGIVLSIAYVAIRRD